MEIKEITLVQRKNLGNYEHREVTLVGVVGEGEEISEVAKLMDAHLLSILNRKEVQLAPVPSKEEVKDEPKKAKVTKKTTKKKPVVDADGGSKEEPSKKNEEEVSESPANVSLAEVKQALAQVWRDKGKSVAIEILREFGVARSEELEESKYQEVVLECQKCLK